MMKFTRLSLFAIAAVLIAAPAFAQSPTITGLHVTVYKTSAPTLPVTTADYASTVMMCGQTPSPATTGVIVNPTTQEFADPAFPPDGTKGVSICVKSKPSDSSSSRHRICYKLSRRCCHYRDGSSLLPPGSPKGRARLDLERKLWNALQGTP